MLAVTLLGSAFLPREGMEPFARALTALGYDVSIAVPRDPRSGDAVVADYIADVVPGSALVAHSNSGNFVPAVAHASSASAAVFLDAAVPPLGGGTWAVVPAELAAALREASTDDDRLPPWTRWWDREETEALFPSPESFHRIDGLAPRVRTSYLDAVATARAGWNADLPCAYLALSDAYGEEVSRATAAGWHVSRYASGHLGMLREPDAVARRTDHLLRVLHPSGAKNRTNGERPR